MPHYKAVRSADVSIKEACNMESILNRRAMQFVRMVDDLALKRLKTRYSFMDADEYADLLRRDVSEGMRVYWSETLERAHLASVTAILRSRHWLSAVLSAQSDRNALVFAAAFRGLMESAADTTTALKITPLTLAHHYQLITDGLSGLATAVVTSSELEDELIHYSHGRHIKRNERAGTPQSHSARSAHAYFKVFENLNADSVAPCYRYLCDLTHPGAPSVSMWLAPMDSKGSEFVLSTEQDETIIGRFLERYEVVALDVLMFAFNAPVLVLNTLNYFPIQKLHTHALLNHDLDGIPAWRQCRNELEKVEPASKHSRSRRNCLTKPDGRLESSTKLLLSAARCTILERQNSG